MPQPTALASRDWSAPLTEILSSGLESPQSHLHPLRGAELSAAVSAALAKPLDYPQLSQIAYDGDCVVIALQAAMKDSQRVLAEILAALNSGRTDPISVTVLADTFTASQLDFGQLPALSLAIHDPDGENQFACLAVGVNDQPLYIHRLLFDADVVIPVGCLGPRHNPETDDCVFPSFSNRQNVNGFREQSEREQTADVQHVNDQLGTFFAIQLVLGPGDVVQAVHAGERRSVLAAAKADLDRAWAISVPPAVDLVIATLESQATEQSWDDFAQALINVAPCCEVSAPIVVCSQLKRTPPKDTRAALVDPTPVTEKKAGGKMVQLRQILSEHPVFLSSHLTQAEVEEIGLGYLTASEELQRLADKSTHGLFLRDAHKCQVTLEQE